MLVIEITFWTRWFHQSKSANWISTFQLITWSRIWFNQSRMELPKSNMFGRARRVFSHFTFCACKMTIATNWRLQHHLINWEINWKYFVVGEKEQKIILIERKRALKLIGIKSYQLGARVFCFLKRNRKREIIVFKARNISGAKWT